MARDTWGRWLQTACGALVAAAVVAGCALAFPTLVGWGDVRYALAVGAAAAWIGWLALYAAAFLATLAMAIVGIGLIVAGRATRHSLK